MANKPELSIKVSVDPVINQTKFQEDINKLIPESNPVKINGKFDAAKMLDGISDYQKGGKNAVTIHGKIDAAEALKSIAKYQEGGQNQAVILGKFTNVKEMLNDFKNETAEINASLTQDSLSNIRDQLQGIINGLDVSKVGSASSEPSKKKPVKGNEKQISVDVTPGTTDESIDILRSKIQNGLTEIPITANISPVQLNAIRKSVTDILADITFDPTVKKVNSASQTTTKKKKIDFPSEDRLSEMMANAQYTATKTESAEAASAKQKNIIYQNLVDHQAKAAESANSATAQTAQGLSDANKAMGDLNTKAEEFGQNWRQVVTLIANATKNLANLMKDNYGGSFGLDIFSSFQEFQKELPNLDTDHVKPYLKTIKDWSDLLLESADGEFNPDIMIQAIHMLSGLADAWNQIDVAKLTNNQTKEKLLQNMSELNSIFPSSGDKEPFLGEKDAAINYLTDLLAKAAKYYAEVGNAVKQTADSIAVANEGFANQTTELKKTNSELERTKQLSFDSPELVVQKEEQKPIELPLPETPNYTKPSETLDDYRDSVGAAANIQQYFASEVDNATASLGSQSETLKALKKSLDEYTGSIDGVEKFAKAEKELDRLKKKLAQQQQQQPAQPAPQPQPNNQPPAPIKPNNNPKPHNNGQPPAPPAPPNNQPPNNGGNNGGSNNLPVENQQKLEQALERIMMKMITAQNKKDTSGDKNYGKNVAEQVKWQGQLHDRAEELIDKLNANYPGWEKSKSWQRHGENIAHARNDYSTAREDKQDLDTVQKLGKELQRNLKLREALHKIDKNIEPVKYQNTQDDIKKSKAEIARLRSEAKAKGLNTNEVTSDFLKSAAELQERLTNKAAAKAKADADDLFDEYKRLTSKLQTYGQKRASSIGSDNVQAQSNVLRDYINTQTELNKLESEFKNRGFLKASSEEWQQTYDLMEKRKDLEKAVEFEVNNRSQAEQEAIRVQDEDRISLLNYIKTVEKYKDRLEQDNHTDDAVYGDSVKMANASWDLLSELNKNPNDKNQVANLWGQKYGIQGVTDLESAFKALAVEAGKAGIKVQDLRTETEKLRSVTQAKTNIANLKSQLIDYLEKFPKVEKTLAEPVQKLKAALADPNAYKNAGQLKQALAELRAQAKSLGLESENLIDKFEKLFGQHLSTMITMAALHKMQDALRIVYQNVVEIDTAMTELRKVTNETDSAYAKFMENAADRAQRVGATMSDTITATADFARLGYSLEDASSISDAALIYKNVGDGISDISAASESLISTMQAFNVEAKNSMKIVDEFNEAGNNFAISSAGVGEALQRSGAALASANNTMEQSIALATTMNRVVQNPEIVGTTLKTVSMYLRSTKADLEAAGESTEGMAETTSKLRDSLKALSHGKVDIFDEVTKQYKSTTDIIIEMGKAWDSMSDKEQAAALELMGGKRNANALSSLIENYQEIEKVIDTVSRASGSAESENQKYLSSINGRLTELDSSFQALSQDVLSSDLVKTGVSFLTSIVKLLDQIVNLTGALPLGLGIGAFVTQLGEPKMTGFMIVPSNTPGGDTEQARCSFYWRSAAREYLVKPTNMVA